MAKQYHFIACYLAAIGLILVAPPTSGTVIPRLVELAQTYFGGVGPALGQVFGRADLTLIAD